MNQNMVNTPPMFVVQALENQSETKTISVRVPVCRPVPTLYYVTY